MGVQSGDLLVAGAVFHDWNPETGTIELSAASTSKLWMQRNILSAIFSYVFDTCGCQLLAMRVSERNQQWNGRGMLRLVTSYGFKTCRIERLYGRDEAGFIFTLTDTDWRANGFHKNKVVDNG